jgi:hypothetical protein
MRAETASEIIADILDDFDNLAIIQSFNELIQSLNNLSATPSPENQNDVQEKKDKLLSSLLLSKLNTYPIGLRQHLDEMTIEGYLPKQLSQKVYDAFIGNDITPALTLKKIEEARNDAQKLYDEGQKFFDSAQFFEIYPDPPKKDEFNFSITIPREAVSNELDDFGRELVKLDKILGVFSEIATGSRDDFKIKSISSSDLTVVLESLPAVAVMIATALERISSLYERMLNIIKLHREMKENKVPENMLKEMEKFIHSTLKQEIEDSAKSIEDGVLRRVETTRRNELRMELRNSLREISSRFDRGYIFDVRGDETEINEDDNDENSNEKNEIRKQREIVAEKRERLKYFKVQDSPILGLPEPNNDQ